MELLTVKLIVLVLMGVVRILCGMLPWAVVKAIKGKWSKSADRRLKKCISVLVFFGGGVMLATCFLHMMPEVQESFNEALPDIHLPIPQIIYVAGFFLVYMLEDIVHALIHKRKAAKRKRKNKKLAKGLPSNGNAGSLVVGIPLPYNNGNADSSSAISVIGKNGDYLNGGLCYANNYPAGDHYRKQQLIGRTTPPPRETKELFDKSIVRKCDDIPGLPKNRTISTTNIQAKSHDITNGPAGNGRVGNGLIVGVEKFSYIDPDWFRDTIIANSQANLLGNTNPSFVDNTVGGGAGAGSKSLHDLHLNKSQNVNAIPDDTNSNSSSSGSTSCSRKKLHEKKGDEKDVESSHAHHHHRHHHDHEDEDDHDEDDPGHFHPEEHSHLPVAFIEEDDETDQTVGAEIRNLLIVIAISFHGVFEGMAIGLQDTVTDVWYMCFAVSLHECTILFCIGVELISNQTKVFRMVLYVLIVSLVSPVGIAIGIVITERSFGPGVVQTIVVGCFQGLAAGSLLYVTFFEIFQEEGRKLHRKYIHILVAILGFVMMGALEFVGGHTHGGSKNASAHSHGHSHDVNAGDDHSDHNHEHAHSAGHHHNETETHEDHHHHDHLEHGHEPILT